MLYLLTNLSFFTCFLIFIVFFAVSPEKRKGSDVKIIVIIFLGMILFNMASLAPLGWYQDLEEERYELSIMLNGVRTNEQLFKLNGDIIKFNKNVKDANEFAQDNVWAGILIRDDKYSSLIDSIPIYYDVNDIPSG
jgi:hypothetical protein